jgi:hypothetical protein
VPTVSRRQRYASTLMDDYDDDASVSFLFCVSNMKTGESRLGRMAVMVDDGPSAACVANDAGEGGGQVVWRPIVQMETQRVFPWYTYTLYYIHRHNKNSQTL